MKISMLLIIFLLFLLCVSPSDSSIDFLYKCTGTNATTTTYSYLREPRIVETGYTRGLTSSSFNYLENGSIDMQETMSYLYGNGTNITNASIEHTMKVNFDGTRGISEFFAKGFFDNNRWISAWKKIRYEESPNVNISGKRMENRSSNVISVDASAQMETTDIMNYRFLYNAKIENGVFQAKDSTGWTNRTGARRYDWEYESLTSGKTLDVTNNLMDSERRPPAAGELGDWLPCWCSGTMPAIEQLDEPWPSSMTLKVLESNRILPSAKLVPVNATFRRLSPNGVSISSIAYRRAVSDKAAVIGKLASMDKIWPLSGQSLYVKRSAPQAIFFNTSSNNTIGSQPGAFYPETRALQVGIAASLPESQSGPLAYNTSRKIEARSGEDECKDGKCKGFEGAYEYDEGPTSESSVTYAAGAVPKVTVRNFYLNSEVYELQKSTEYAFGSGDITSNLESAGRYLYNFEVQNTGTVTMSDVTLSVEMAKGIRAIRAFYFPNTTGELDAEVSPFNEDILTTVICNLNTISPSQKKSVVVEAYVKTGVEKKDVSIEVKGKDPDGSELRRSQISAKEVGCECKTRDSPPRPCDPLAKDEDKIRLGYVEICPPWTKNIG